MYKVFNFLLFSLIIIFMLSVFKYYTSSKNIVSKDYNRSNVDQILKEKISNLPVLKNDTNNVIVFNDSFENEMNEGKKKRSFWELLKSK
tara:strand:- start:260 stop:526 length:267 start_codon:yes stop_codon:yes gene_type:complete